MAAFTRTNVSIDSATPGWKLDAWLYKPTKGSGPFPAVVLAHGFGGRKAHGLQAFAERFAESGRIAIPFDYRHWGASDGLPRDHADYKKQREDYKSVVAWAKKRDDVDPTKVVLWGSSWSGGLVTQLASEDKTLAGAIAQCPAVDGTASFFMTPIMSALRVAPWVIIDSLKHYILPSSFTSPTYIPAASEPGAGGFLDQPDCLSGYESFRPTVEPEDEDNKKCRALAPGVDVLAIPRIRASVALQVLVTRPIDSAGKIEIPLLLIVPETDSVASVPQALKAVKRAKKGELLRVPGGHFAPYKGAEGHELSLKGAIEFLDRVAKL